MRFAKYLADDIDDLYFGAVTATSVELWAIQEIRHNITEVIHRA